jgi:hypothetical protein
LPLLAWLVYSLQLQFINEQTVLHRGIMTPKAGFQTVWVQQQLKKLKAKANALKAQFIKPNEII